MRRLAVGVVALGMLLQVGASGAIAADFEAPVSVRGTDLKEVVPMIHAPHARPLMVQLATQPVGSNSVAVIWELNDIAPYDGRQHHTHAAAFTAGGQTDFLRDKRFEVLSSPDGSEFVKVATIEGPTNRFLHRRLRPNVLVYYKVKAYDASGKLLAESPAVMGAAGENLVKLAGHEHVPLGPIVREKVKGDELHANLDNTFGIARGARPYSGGKRVLYADPGRAGEKDASFTSTRFPITPTSTYLQGGWVRAPGEIWYGRQFHSDEGVKCWGYSAPEVRYTSNWNFLVQRIVPDEAGSGFRRRPDGTPFSMAGKHWMFPKEATHMTLLVFAFGPGEIDDHWVIEIKGRADRRKITRHCGDFEMDREIPVDLRSPAVDGRKPIAVKSVQFNEKDGNLHCLVKIEGATIATATFAIRVKVLGSSKRIPVALAHREFEFETRCVIRRRAGLIRSEKDLDFGPMERFASARRFEVEMALVGEAGRREERREVSVLAKIVERPFQARPGWIEGKLRERQQSHAYWQEVGEGRLAFHVREPGRTMKWVASLETGIDPKEYQTLVFRYRAEHLCTAKIWGNDYFLWLPEGPSVYGGYQAVAPWEVIPDGRTHEVRVDLSRLGFKDKIHHVILQVFADEEGGALLQIEKLAFVGSKLTLRGGPALGFDGKSDFVVIPNSPSLDLKGSLTLEARVRSEGDSGQIIWRGDTRAYYDPYELHVVDGKMEFRIDGNFRGQHGSFVVRSREPLANEFHFWSGVYDKRAGMLYLYKDGVLEASEEIFGEIDYDGSSMWNMIGAVDRGNWQHFRGTIDEVRIWNVARKPGEIKRDADRRLTGREGGLVACWTFDEGSGQLVHDISPNQNEGVLGASAYPDDSDPVRVGVGEAVRY